PTPEQNSIPVDFQRRLINHEMVHVKQISALQTGVTGIFSRFGGQQYTGIVAAMLPFWFLEGDGIIYETLLTPGGRGNNPSFNKELKALYIGKHGGYSFDKMLLGSYRDHTPSHYHYGFRMMEYSRSKYGSDLWKENVSYVASKPFLINPLNFSLRKSGTATKKKLFTETFEEFTKLWRYESQLDAPVEYAVINPSKNDDYINYHSPVIIGSDSLIAFKSSYSEPLSIVLIGKDMTEKRILYTGWVDPYFLSYGGGKMVWAEIQNDYRWENRGFSIIAVHDLQSGLTSRITRRSRLFAPAISPDGSTIAAIETTTMNQSSLVFIDAATGLVKGQVVPPGNGYPQRPAWSDDGAKVTVILLNESGEGVFTYSIASEEWAIDIEPSSNDLQAAFLRNDTIFFTSSAGGTDNIFLRTPEGDIRRVTRSRFGTGSFSLSGSKIVFSDYDHKGFSIASATLTAERVNYQDKWELPSTLIKTIDLPGIEEGTSVNPANEPTPVYVATPYRKWQNPLRFHSWTPFYFDLDEITTDPAAVTPGITLFSQNLLSTVITSVGYQYTGGEHKLHSGITWKGWYPVVDFRLSYGGEPSIVTGNNDVEPSVIYPSLSTGTEVYLPLQFTSGAYSQYLRISFYHRYNNRYIYSETDDLFDYGQSFISWKLFFSNSRQSSYRDIFPVFAQALELNYTNAPFDREIYGTIASLRASLYFPGIIRNHGFRVRLQAERQVPEEYIQYNRINFPRGYSEIISERLGTLSADYVFPIAYPDIAAGSIVYL
ncbi:MAG: hypothetical protein IH591_14980, partial [Bacteroidales bacterium]|nr:hypothetical protein [Bacteroidales bacterium]